MKFLIPALPLGLGVFFWLYGLRPLAAPCDAVRIRASAKDFWIEFDDRVGGTLRHKWGGAWPLREYGGESGRLWRIRPIGLDQPFLVFRHGLGTQYARTVVWHLPSRTAPVLVADIESVGELRGEGEDELRRLLFQDVDHDGIEELRQAITYMAKSDNHEPDWAMEETFHRWTGSSFVPAWTRFEAFGHRGPLAALKRMTRPSAD